MINYQTRTIEPIVSALVDEMKRKFLSKTARSQGHSIIYFRDPFKLTPVSQMAEIADKFTRNEILSPNEIRSEIGYKPNDDPRSDELRNRNISMSNEEFAYQNGESPMVPEEGMEEEQPQTKEERIQSILDAMNEIE